MILEFWILTLLLFASGYLLGRWHNRRRRYDRVAAAQRLLQLKVLSLELKSLRSKVISAQGQRTPSVPTAEALSRLKFHPFPIFCIPSVRKGLTTLVLWEKCAKHARARESKAAKKAYAIISPTH